MWGFVVHEDEGGGGGHLDALVDGHLGHSHAHRPVGEDLLRQLGAPVTHVNG